MLIQGKKYAITGASSGLGAALAITLADGGATPILLARNQNALHVVAETIAGRCGQTVDTIVCDLTSIENCVAAAETVKNIHPDLYGLIHNGAMWLPGSFDDVSDGDMQACVTSASVGALVLTKHLLPLLHARSHAEIHTVVSTSGLVNTPLCGTSIAFKAAKAAQRGFVEGLTDELKGTSIRVSAVYPDGFDDISPVHSSWDDFDTANNRLSNREVVAAIMFALNMPVGTVMPAMVLR